MKYIKTNNLVTYTHIDDFNKESFVYSIIKSEFYPNTKYAFGVRILNSVTGRFDILPYFTYLQISEINKGDLVKHIEDIFKEMHDTTLEFLNDSYYNNLENFNVELFTFKCFYRKKSDIILE